jgi:hypothetical protein
MRKIGLTHLTTASFLCAIQFIGHSIFASLYDDMRKSLKFSFAVHGGITILLKQVTKCETFLSIL